MDLIFAELKIEFNGKMKGKNAIKVCRCGDWSCGDKETIEVHFDSYNQGIVVEPEVGDNIQVYAYTSGFGFVKSKINYKDVPAIIEKVRKLIEDAVPLT